MRDYRRPHWLGRLLPTVVRREVFDPAIQDLRVRLLGRTRGGPWRRATALTWHGAAVAVLLVQCWLGALTGRTADVAIPSPRPGIVAR